MAAGFEPVAAAFADNFSRRSDVGAACTVYRAGSPVVDLWGGPARPGKPWGEDTMCSVFSTTKGPLALVVQILADRSELDVGAPVAAYWPEFADAGKESITVQQVLTHTSGVITFPSYNDVLNLEDHWAAPEAIRAGLAVAAPLWEPGTQHGYHALTFGWILGEVVRRITGADLGKVFRHEVAEPLGLDFWIGTPEAFHSRVADLRDAPDPIDPAVAAYLSLFTPDTWTGRAHFVGEHGIGRVAEFFNSAVVRSAEIPAAGGIGTARSLARMYGCLAVGGTLDGVRIASERSITAHSVEQVRGFDTVLLFETAYALGFAKSTADFPLGPNPEAFGHGGLGGSLAFGDPVDGIGFAYTPNQLLFAAPGSTTRSRALVDALYRSL